MRRLKHLAFLPGLVLLLCLASSGSAQTPWKALDTKAGTGTPSGEAEGLPATDQEIDQRIAQIQSRLAGLRAQRGETAGPAAVSGLPPGEAAEWKRWNLQLVYVLESREQALKDLKSLRQEIRQHGAGGSAPQALSGSPPYPVSALGNLYDRIFALRGELKTLEVQRAIREANLNAFLKAREESEKQLRRAEELLTRSTGKPDAARARWQRDLARLRSELNNEGALAEDTFRLVATEKIQASRNELRSLEDQYRAAENASPVTKEELDRKLAELEAKRKERESLLAAAILEESSSKTALGKTREALRLAQESARPDPSRIAQLKSAEEAEKIRMGTAASKIEIYQGSLKIVNFEEALWQDRYRFGRTEDLGTLREKQAEVDKALKQINFWKESFGKAAVTYSPLIHSENEKLRSGKLSKREEASVRTLVAAYRDRQMFWSQAVDGLGQVERIALRWKEDLDYRLGHASAAARAMGTGRSVLSVFGKLWNTELYVAEETTVVEGQKIVRPFSVTVGKVVKALLILLAGLWVSGRLRGPVRRFATRRFGLDEPGASQLERKWTFFTFLLLLAFSLALVNIPLAVFAFFGGILAIGIGFGAQHLIGNFISSIILMFDRTISVGDLVEMEGQFGRVKSIGLRSSSIQRFDGVEVLVPNSQFLEQKVTNWTLSDRKVRYEIVVGVSYGAPTREVADRILEVVRGDGRVQVTPDPVVIFESFGESAMMFRVFFWLFLDPGVDNRVVCSDLRHRIKESLDQAGIVIAFPQRDVRLEAKGPIEVKVLPSDEAAGPRP